MNEGGKDHTICWMCSKATGGCSWSSKIDPEPVSGWTAISTVVRVTKGAEMQTYIVRDCPEFVQDSEEFGLRRVRE